MIAGEMIADICEELKEKDSVFRQLPKNGVLHIEKLLPYICVYRYWDRNKHFEALLKTQSTYLIIDQSVDISPLVGSISKFVSEKLRAFLIIEIWPYESMDRPYFDILCPEGIAPATIGTLCDGFRSLRDINADIAPRVTNTAHKNRKGLKPLVPVDGLRKSCILPIGIAFPMLYQGSGSDKVYSLFHRKLSVRYSEIIKRAAYEFMRVQTSNPFSSYSMMGKVLIDKKTLKADKKLAKISDNLSFLLAVTPVNSFAEWITFKKSNYRRNPDFQYRPIALDPEREKRKLFNIRIDKIQDPTIAFILREKRLELEKKLIMLEERGKDGFRCVGQSLYGNTAKSVVHIAKGILDKYAEPSNIQDSRRLDCREFAKIAQTEIDHYRKKFPDIDMSLEVREDVAGVMVSKSKLLLNKNFTISKARTDALIQHEIGTHILTYCNGKSQPLKQMHAGFANYDGLQEGIAVLSEYLVNGLTVNRLRKLAGRVLAVEAMLKGLSFVENFDLLMSTYKFRGRIAYNIVMRIYRGGGLSKDAVYLTGLVNVMEYLKDGGKIDTLYLGKYNIDHIALVEELLQRDILKKPVLPQFLERDSVKNRVQKVRNGLKVIDLLD